MVAHLKRSTRDTAIAAALSNWEQTVRAMEAPDFELYCEEFSLVNEAVLWLEQTGQPVDRGLLALVRILRRQLVNTGADSDQDESEPYYLNEWR